MLRRMLAKITPSKRKLAFLDGFAGPLIVSPAGSPSFSFGFSVLTRPCGSV